MTREQYRKYWRLWVKNHRVQYLAKKRANQNKRRFGGLREAVLRRDGGCKICRTQIDLTVDHIDRNRKNNTLTNLQTLCRPCHGRKDGIARKIKSGWHFRRKPNVL